jgi:predicted transposase YbfD/YdcC
VQGANFLLTVKANQRSLYRQITDQLVGKRKIPFMATDHEVGHGRDITSDLRAKEAPQHITANWHGATWNPEVITKGIRDGRPFKATRRFIASLLTTPEALLRLVREWWSIESWHWIRVTQLNENNHRYRGNGAGVMAAMRTAAMNLLRLTGFDSIRQGLQAVMQDIKTLLAMARR